MSAEEMTPLAVEIGRLGQKMEDQDRTLGRIEEQTKATNGHVADVDRRLSRLQGAVAALSAVTVAGIPVALFLAPHIH
jgi:hypothetical protein